MKEKILSRVEQARCIKDVDLILSIMSETGPTQFNQDEFTETITELIFSRLIIEIKYGCDKNYGYVYLPYNTCLKITKR